MVTIACQTVNLVQNDLLQQSLALLVVVQQPGQREYKRHFDQTYIYVRNCTYVQIDQFHVRTKVYSNTSRFQTCATLRHLSMSTYILHESRVFVLFNGVKTKAIGQKMSELCGHESG